MASGVVSHASGWFTNANGWSSFVLGEYNADSNIIGSYYVDTSSPVSTVVVPTYYIRNHSSIRIKVNGVDVTYAASYSYSISDTAVSVTSANGFSDGDEVEIYSSYTRPFIIGNGSINSPHNAFAVDWNGNGWYAGNLYVGGTSQDDAIPLTAVQIIKLEDGD